MDLPLKWMDLVPKKLVWLILEIVRAPILLEKLFPVTFDCEAICEICLLASLVLTVEVWEVDLKKKSRQVWRVFEQKNYLFQHRNVYVTL